MEADPNRFELRCERPWLELRFARPQRMVSWALHRPGFVEATRVVWREVGAGELNPGVDAAAWFEGELASAHLADAVGMLTARNVASFTSRTARVGDIEASCVVTLGLRNAERVGRRLIPEGAFAPGTINIFCHVTQPLTDAALLEAAAIVVQARTVAVLSIGHRKDGTHLPVTGTGTDCVVMASPAVGPRAPFAGMHTGVGEAIGACVLEATEAAARTWIEAHG